MTITKKERKTAAIKYAELEASGLKFQNRDHFPLSFDEITPEELAFYDLFIVAFSGGKDSVSCVLRLLKLGVPKTKIELWHHLVDGREGSALMDWAITEDYCRKFAKALDLKIYFSWRIGGFEGEMLKKNTRSLPIRFEEEDNLIECGLEVREVCGKNGSINTRLMFPQVSPDLRIRWCSAQLKIGVCTAAINNQKRLLNKKIMVLSGERAQESAGRSEYLELEVDACDCRNNDYIKPGFKKQRIIKDRYVDRCRPVHKWSEQQVWDILREFKINPHPAYRLGWGRLSCMTCIFGSCNQWASIRKIDQKRFGILAAYEKQFGKTIQRTKNVNEMADKGIPYKDMPEELIAIAMKTEFNENIIVENWVLPKGAFGESAGPT